MRQDEFKGDSLYLASLAEVYAMVSIAENPSAKVKMDVDSAAQKLKAASATLADAKIILKNAQQRLSMLNEQHAMADEDAAISRFTAALEKDRKEASSEVAKAKNVVEQACIEERNAGLMSRVAKTVSQDFEVSGLETANASDITAWAAEQAKLIIRSPKIKFMRASATELTESEKEAVAAIQKAEQAVKIAGKPGIFSVRFPAVESSSYKHEFPEFSEEKIQLNSSNDILSENAIVNLKREQDFNAQQREAKKCLTRASIFLDKSSIEAVLEKANESVAFWEGHLKEAELMSERKPHLQDQFREAVFRLEMAKQVASVSESRCFAQAKHDISEANKLIVRMGATLAGVTDKISPGLDFAALKKKLAEVKEGFIFAKKKLAAVHAAISVQNFSKQDHSSPLPAIEEDLKVGVTEVPTVGVSLVRSNRNVDECQAWRKIAKKNSANIEASIEPFLIKLGDLGENAKRKKLQELMNAFEQISLSQDGCIKKVIPKLQDKDRGFMSVLYTMLREPTTLLTSSTIVTAVLKVYLVHSNPIVGFFRQNRDDSTIKAYIENPSAENLSKVFDHARNGHEGLEGCLRVAGGLLGCNIYADLKMLCNHMIGVVYPDQVAAKASAAAVKIPVVIYPEAVDDEKEGYLAPSKPK